MRDEERDQTPPAPESGPSRGGHVDEALPSGGGRQIRQDSDALLDAVERLKRAEERKRETPFASEAFDQRAREVEERARELFRLAALEESHGERLDARDEAEPAGRVAGGTQTIGDVPNPSVAGAPPGASEEPDEPWRADAATIPEDTDPDDV